MRVIVALMLMFVIPGMLYTQETESVPKRIAYDDGYAEGRRDGGSVNQSQWVLRGFGGGLIGCCLGGGVVYFLASGDSPSSIPEGSNEYRAGYVEGYNDATKSRQRSSALLGGIVGTAITAGAILLIAFAAGAGMS
jgi:hypothetical protein